MPGQVDDPDINNDEVLFRRISPDQVTIDSGGQPCISDGAFRTSEMSVNIASRVTPLESLNSSLIHYSVAAFTAGFARSLGCIVASDSNDPTHALICRKDDASKRLTGSQAKRFSQQAVLVVYRPGPKQRGI